MDYLARFQHAANLPTQGASDWVIKSESLEDGSSAADRQNTAVIGRIDGAIEVTIKGSRNQL